MEKHYTEGKTITLVINKSAKADRLGIEMYKPVSWKKEKKNGQTRRRSRS